MEARGFVPDKQPASWRGKVVTWNEAAGVGSAHSTERRRPTVEIKGPIQKARSVHEVAKKTANFLDEND